MIPVRVYLQRSAVVQNQEWQKYHGPDQAEQHDPQQNFFVMFFEEIHALNSPAIV